MDYLIEYEVIGNKVCGIVKEPNTGAPVFTTVLYDNHADAIIAVQNYIASYAQIVEQAQKDLATKRKCCGR